MVIRKIYIALVIILLASSAWAESLFLKDGTILEGRVIKGTDAAITIRTRKGRQTVPRRNVLRTLYSTNYKDRVYIYQKVGPTIVGHIVEEGRTYYLVRRNLNSRREVRIIKNNVETISQKAVSGGVLKAKRGKSPFRRHLGLRIGTSVRWGDLLSTHTYKNGSFNNSVDTPHTMNWDAVFFQLYYYDYWFEFNASWQPTMKPAYATFPELKEEAGSSYGFSDKEHETDFSSVSFTGYPFRIFDLDLGITLGHMHHRISWLLIDQNFGNNSDDAPNFLKLQYQALFAGITYRFLDAVRVGASIMFPYYLYVEQYEPYTTFTPTQGGFEEFLQGTMVPGFYLSFELFIVKNLTFSIEYYFMYYNLRRSDYIAGDVNFEELGYSGQEVEYISHRISFAIGYGFNL